jgi:hypothetical protein
LASAIGISIRFAPCAWTGPLVPPVVVGWIAKRESRAGQRDELQIGKAAAQGL